MKTIDFYGKRKLYFTISLVIILVTLIFAFAFGVELDIQFKGGTIITYNYTGDIDLNTFESTMEDLTGSGLSVQEGVDVATGVKNLKVSLVEAKGIDSSKQVEILDKLNEAFPNNDLNIYAVNSVDPTIGQEFLLKSLVAVLLASVLMIVYVGIRFRTIGGWSAGIMSVVALFHDVFVAFAAFVILGYPINDNFIAVVLTILGFSLNDTIIIYDRVRENKRLYGTKISFAEMVNLSITQSISRSVATSFAALMAMAVVAIMAVVFNVTSIVTFAVPMILGLISGVYSTICIAGPLYVMWHNYREKQKRA